MQGYRTENGRICCDICCSYSCDYHPFNVSLRRTVPVTSRKELCHTINILCANIFMYFWTERYKEINKEIIK
jgi:hypothetical protein